ncbi:hypothetical protein ACFL2U_01640 [Patescibacteria group bacterium]
MKKIIKKIIKFIGKAIYTGVVASMLGVAKSYGYKTKYQDTDKEKRIESEK